MQLSDMAVTLVYMQRTAYHSDALSLSIAMLQVLPLRAILIPGFVNKPG